MPLHSAQGGSSSVLRVTHGATAGTARPTTAGMVIWFGSVEPSNMAAGDIWVDNS